MCQVELDPVLDLENISGFRDTGCIKPCDYYQYLSTSDASFYF